MYKDNAVENVVAETGIDLVSTTARLSDLSMPLKGEVRRSPEQSARQPIARSGKFVRRAYSRRALDCEKKTVFFLLFTRSRLQSHEGEFWSGLVVGLPALSRPVVSASLHKQCTKRNRGFTDEGRVETKEKKERRRTEELGGLEICESAESVKSGLS